MFLVFFGKNRKIVSYGRSTGQRALTIAGMVLHVFELLFVLYIMLVVFVLAIDKCYDLLTIKSDICNVKSNMVGTSKYVS